MEFLIGELHKEWENSGSETEKVVLTKDEANELKRKVMLNIVRQQDVLTIIKISCLRKALKCQKITLLC